MVDGYPFVFGRRTENRFRAEIVMAQVGARVLGFPHGCKWRTLSGLQHGSKKLGGVRMSWTLCRLRLRALSKRLDATPQVSAVVHGGDRAIVRDKRHSAYESAGLGRGNFSILGLPEIDLFVLSGSLLATNLPLFSRRLHLPVAVRLDLLLPPRQHVLRRDVARGAGHADVVVVVQVSAYQTSRILRLTPLEPPTKGAVL